MEKIRYIGRENADTRFLDGALRPILGAHNVQVMRTNRAHPELSQGSDFTYNHAPMLCRYHGFLYLMYLSSPVHEHDGVARALLSRSADGYSWSFPEIVFPDLPVPSGVYRGNHPELLPPDARTVVHHRMGFYRAPNDVLLVMTHHGVSPEIHTAPNSGYGMGRVVRRINPDGSMGDIFVLRVNREGGWRPEHFPYPLYEACDDPAFVEACRALLRDRLATGAWWEEERLDEAFFPLRGMSAPSFCALPDGKVAAIGKMGMFALSEDGGESWTELEHAEGVRTSMGKCLLTRGGDGRYVLLYNPSPDGQHRWPLAAVTSGDGYTYEHMCLAAGDVAPMRYGGYLKNFGINYIRGIMPGNDDAPDGDLWAAYSMNKEDIWALRLPPTITDTETEPVHDRFETLSGPVPDRWYTYSPIWARVALEEGKLTLRDSDPYDYAKAVRAFPAAERVRISLTVSAEGLRNGALYIDVSDEKGMTASRLILAPSGEVRMRAGDGEWPIATFRDGESLALTLEVDCVTLRTFATINGQRCKTYAIMCPTVRVERLTLRTGPVCLTPTMEDNLKNVCLPDLPDPGERLPEAIYRLERLDVDAL